MKIKLIDNLKSNINNSNIRWHLSGQIIWIGKEQNYEEIEETLIEKSYGSVKWLYSDADTLLFDRKKLIFTTGVIKVIEPINLTEESFDFINVNSQEGTIKLDEAKYFDYEFGECTKYHFKEDILVCYESSFKLDEPIITVSITEDFDFIVKENELVGWVLRNSSRHIVKDGMNCIDSIVQNSDYTKEILVKYLSCINQLNEELMDDEEEKLKNDFKILYESIETCSESPLVAIKENILNVLDFM